MKLYVYIKKNIILWFKCYFYEIKYKEHLYYHYNSFKMYY